MNHSRSIKKIKEDEKICFTCNEEECEGNAEDSI